MTKIAFLVLMIILVTLLFVLAITFLVRGIILNSEAYKVAIEAIESDPEIVANTGRIENYGFMPMGNMSIRNGYGRAAWSIKVIGYSKTVNVQVLLTKEKQGDWQVSELNLITK